MSTLALDDVLNRTLLDGEFRHAVQADPGTALDGLDLTNEERSAIRSRSLAALAPQATSPDPPPITFTIAQIVIVITWETGTLAGNSPAARAAELTRRGGEIVRMAGDRVEPIKELLALMR